MLTRFFLYIKKLREKSMKYIVSSFQYCCLLLLSFPTFAEESSHHKSINHSAIMVNNQCINAQLQAPTLYIWNRDNLTLTKQRLSDASSANPHPPLAKAYKALLQQANQALEEGPFSVVFKKTLPASQDKHDYYSVGPYWWPNPATDDGLPYIRKDGVVNPERRSADSDNTSLSKLTRNVATLALAGFFSDNQKYSHKAAELLRVWFLNKATRMNPNLNHAQAIPGITTGRDIGIIDSYRFVKVIDAIGLLSYAGVLSDAEITGLKHWFSDYSHWLLTSENGKSERKRVNNHGLYYDVQLAMFSIFTNDLATTQLMLESIKQHRIPTQINAKGQMPHELKRTKSFSYTGFTLRGFMDAADIGECIGNDLWSFTTDKGISIQSAIDFQASYANRLDQWQFEQISDINTEKLLLNLLRAEDAYPEQQYHSDVNTYRSQHPDSLHHLLFPSR